MAVTPFWVFNGLSVTATDAVIAAIAARADVATVEDDVAEIVPLRSKPCRATPARAGAHPDCDAHAGAEHPAPIPTSPVSPRRPPDPPEPNITAVNAPALWSLGDTGQGIVVASLDSGVDVGHPDLAPRWRGGTNSWFDPYGQHPDDADGHDRARHGDDGRDGRR